MSPAGSSNAPEARARARIDQALTEAGWTLQDRDDMNLAAASSIAVREFKLDKGHGFVDYMLFLDGHPVGVCEAKPAGTALIGVEHQVKKYVDGIPPALAAPYKPLPFAYLSTGEETLFINHFDPHARTRPVFAFHRPDTLREWLTADTLDTWLKRPGGFYTAADDTKPSTLRARLRAMPPIELPGMWPNKVQAVANIEKKGGAGQYFTPRPLIDAIVDCIQPKPGEVIADPACGTGGFLLSAHRYIEQHYQLDKGQKKALRYDALRGVELVDSVTRLCAMNLSLHGIGPDDDRRKPPIKTDDSLRNEPGETVQVVLTSPPFGKKSSITVVNGIFYAQGVKANVLFFDRKPGAKEPWTKKVWIYDLRTNKDFTLKTRRMARADLDEFVTSYNPANRNQRRATWDEKKHPDSRWRVFTYDEIVARDKRSLDIFWLKDESLEDSANLPEPHVLAEEIADDLRSALEQIESVLADLQQRAASVGNSK